MQTVTEEGGKYEFGPDQRPPTGPSAKTEMDITKVGTKQTPIHAGHDTYKGIPGDGIIPG